MQNWKKLTIFILECCDLIETFSCQTTIASLEYFVNFIIKSNVLRDWLINIFQANHCLVSFCKILEYASTNSTNSAPVKRKRRRVI